MSNWLIPIAVGALVAGIAFLAASAIRQKAKQPSSDAVAAIVSESAKLGVFEHTREAHDAPKSQDISPNSRRWWKAAGAVGGLAVIALVIFDPLGFGAPSCASNATQELVFQIAKEHDTLVGLLAGEFDTEPKTAAEAEARRALDAAKDQLNAMRQAAGCKSVVILIPSPCTNSTVATAEANVDSLSQNLNNIRSREYHKAYEYAKEHIEYSLDAVRMTDKSCWCRDLCCNVQRSRRET